MSDNDKSQTEQLMIDDLRHRLSMLDAENRTLHSKLAAAEERAKVWEECCEAMRKTLMAATRRA